MQILSINLLYYTVSTIVIISEEHQEGLLVDQEETHEVQVWIIRVKMAMSATISKPTSPIPLKTYQGLLRLEEKQASKEMQ